MSITDELKNEKKLPVVMADHNGIIFFVNQKFEEVFLWASNEIIGKSITTIIPNDLHDAHNLGFARFLTTEQSTILNQPLLLAAMKKNGVVFSAEHIIQSEKKNGLWIFAATIRPLEEMSDNVLKEEEISRVK